MQSSGNEIVDAIVQAMIDAGIDIQMVDSNGYCGLGYYFIPADPAASHSLFITDHYMTFTKRRTSIFDAYTFVYEFEAANPDFRPSEIADDIKHLIESDSYESDKIMRRYQGGFSGYSGHSGHSGAAGRRR